MHNNTRSNAARIPCGKCGGYVGGKLLFLPGEVLQTESRRIRKPVKNIESLMHSLNLTLDKALDTLGVPEDIRSEVSKRVTVALENK